MKIKNSPLLYSLYFLSTFLTFSQNSNTKQNIYHDIAARTILITDNHKNLSIKIDYAKGCKISEVLLKGKNIISSNGVSTGFKIKNAISSEFSDQVKVYQNKNAIVLDHIKYSDLNLSVTEKWTFSVSDEQINWNIERTYSNNALLEASYFPKWHFKDLSVWKGGIIDNGGMVWCKYLSNSNDTYGVHTGGVTFWNPESGNALRIDAKTEKGLEISSMFSHSESNEFTFTQSVTDTVLSQRYNLSRFVSGKSDIFKPFSVNKSTISMNLALAYVDYDAAYSRGKLSGIDETAVRELLNTTGRYGVVDNNIAGANGWLTNWKCLHEPFFAQIGLALNDPNYTENMTATLDQERDLAMLPDGRVLSRWHNAPGDEIPGTYNNQTGYYEAKWGYTIDSQTGYIINTSEQFNLNGDTQWLLSHKESCERALDWLIRRDSDNNGIFEMINNSISEEKASDWLDIVWAGYENAFVNAQMYEALTLWAECENTLGDLKKSKYYTTLAQKLKDQFNKPIDNGGFWSEDKNQYVYWRDKDGSIHGDNLVTPVNFAAIAFGICDDPQRISKVLDQIEQRNTAENLFHWPLCFDSFERAEVSGGNWPFPKYENGDIFPTWGYLGIRAYAGYNKEIALKYIKNILLQYRKDGLSSQRYSRITQKGLGDDILAGISTTITALYSDIYGISPKWNRMGLEPHMLSELNDTEFPYTLRDTLYQVKLHVNNYTLSTNDFSVTSNSNFGVSQKNKEVVVYKDNKEINTIHINKTTQGYIALEITSWSENSCSWRVKNPGKYTFTFTGLKPNTPYTLKIDENNQLINSKKDGSLDLKFESNKRTTFKLEKAASK
tara:strand:+ start:7620 stop:10127 length:2508 start_codon:yes stop_codon:yes gene_type:complete